MDGGTAELEKGYGGAGAKWGFCRYGSYEGGRL